MKYDIENKKVSAMVEELGEEYKGLLIEKALSQHQEYDVDQINLSTLIWLDEIAKKSLRSNNRKDRRDRLLSMFSVAGLIYALLGLMLLSYYLLLDYSFVLEPIARGSILIIAIGLIMSLCTILVKSIPVPPYYGKDDTSKYFNYKIINTWKQIEGLLVQLTPAEENMNLNKMLSNLMDIKLLSSSDVSTIKKMLNLRNQIVHSNSIEKKYTTDEIQALLRDSNNLIKKLTKFENN